MSHYILPCGNYKRLDNTCALDFPTLPLLRRIDRKDVFFLIDGEIPLELHDSVKDFVCPCINRPVTKDYLIPHDISL